MAHKFDKVEFDAKKKDHGDAKANPKTNGVPAIAVRLAALEKLAGVN